ncbi:hypothetical protein RHGRI_001556 [Rhododendron griersonianum]|uniref:Uncharacterized protein n=1 Tax=Rhododendron griersonianum TaxID=479676 RepID=A0AAV6LLP1_9ERIC|nr:hypothetical protein RHGRI_001556 [Rhododendron griersonianum]
MLLSKQPLSRTEIYNSVETSVNSDGEHSKSLADEEGDYAEASELYSRSLEIKLGFFLKNLDPQGRVYLALFQIVLVCSTIFVEIRANDRL